MGTDSGSGSADRERERGRMGARARTSARSRARVAGAFSDERGCFSWDSCRDALVGRRELRSRPAGVNPVGPHPAASAGSWGAIRWGAGIPAARWEGMSPTEKQAQLPHHKLIAYELALDLVQLVARTRIGEA